MKKYILLALFSLSVSLGFSQAVVWTPDKFTAAYDPCTGEITGSIFLGNSSGDASLDNFWIPLDLVATLNGQLRQLITVGVEMQTWNDENDCTGSSSLGSFGNINCPITPVFQSGCVDVGDIINDESKKRGYPLSICEPNVSGIVVSSGGSVYLDYIYSLPVDALGESVTLELQGTWSGGGTLNSHTISIPNLQSPSGLLASDDECERVILSWTNPAVTCTSDEVGIYGEQLDGSYVYLTSVPTSATPEQIFTGLLPGEPRNYKATLIRTWNHTTVSSSTSNVVEGNARPRPNTPSNVSASTDNCDGTIDLTWDYPGANPDSFQISMNGVIVAVIDGGARIYNQGGLTRGVYYTFSVKSQDDCPNLSDASNTVTGISPSEPTAPTNLTVDTSGFGLLVAWNHSQFHTSYVVKRSLSGIPGTTDFSVAASDSTYLDNSILVCNTYIYEVFAKDNVCASGTGGVSNGTSVTGIAAPKLDQVFNANSLNTSKGYYNDRIELSWIPDNNGSSITNYKVFRKILGETVDSVEIGNTVAGFFIDYTADAGILYEYTVIGEVKCEGNTLYSNTDQAIGFRRSLGIINGHIDYTGGIAVEGVKVIAENLGSVKGTALELNGTNQYAYLNNSTGSLDLVDSFTLEAMVRPDAAITGVNTIISKTDNYDLVYDQTLGQLYFEVNTSVGLQRLTYNTTLPAINYTQVTAVLSTDSMYLYVNGIKSASQLFVTSTLLSTNPNVSIGASGAGTNFFHGIIDEVRIWNKAKTAQEITNDFSRSMSGSEDHLIAYWKFDEEGGDYAYDFSKTGSTFNKNELTLINTPIWSTTIPSQNDLSYAGYTNAYGDYSIVVDYSGIGQNYEITPVFGTHQFTPGNKVLYVGDGSFVHNSIDFIDISAFQVTGLVTYKGETCPVEGANIYIDGSPVIKLNAPVLTKADGTYDIQVPIGEHIITIAKYGHVFNIGRFPLESIAESHDFQEAITGVDFQDSTLITVVGRVVGGDIQGDKKPIIEPSKNNVGVTDITFDYGGCFTKTVSTDPITGQYTIQLPPLKYNPSLSIPTNIPLPATLGALSVIDISTVPAMETIYDTTFITPTSWSSIDSVSYQLVQDYIFYNNPEVVILDETTRKPFSGDSSYSWVNTIIEDTVEVDLSTDPFALPIFTQGRTYQAFVNVFESYTNYDGGGAGVIDSVQVTNGQLTFDNQLAAAGTTVLQLDLNDLTQLGDFEDSLAHIVYTFEAGDPSFAPNPVVPEYSYSKTFNASVVSGANSDLWEPVTNVPAGGDNIFRGIIFGAEVKGAQYFTQGPEVVDFILRDPPGSNSYATLEEGQVFSHEESYSIDYGVGVSAANSVYAGAKFTIGLGFNVETDLKIDLKLGMKTTISNNNSGSLTYSNEITEAWNTNATTILAQSNGDLYIGKSKNVDFGIAEYLLVVPDSICPRMECLLQASPGFSFARNQGLSMVPGGYETGFIYSQYHIENVEIPKIVNIRNIMLLNDPRYQVNPALPITDANFGKSNDDEVFGVLATGNPNIEEIADYTGPSYTYTPVTDEPDTIRAMNQQIRLWQDAIRKNEEEKLLVTDPILMQAELTKQLTELYLEYEEDIELYNTLDAVNTLSIASIMTLNTINGPDGHTVASALVYGVNAVVIEDVYARVLEYNALRDNIIAAFSAPSKNHSYSAGAVFTSSQTFETTNLESTSLTFDISSELETEISGKINNTGIGVKRTISMDFKKSNSSSSTSTDTRTVGYTLDDPDLGDYFSVDVFPSIYGNGPIFKRRPGGATRCPHEGYEFTKYSNPGDTLHYSSDQRQKPDLSINTPVLYNIPADQAGVFTLTLTNLAEDETIQDYELVVDAASNPFGAFLSVDGNAIGNTYSIPFNGPIQKILTIEKGNGSVYEFDSLMLLLRSTCESSIIYDSIFVSVHFIPNCTEAVLVNPTNQWVVNNSFNDTLLMATGGYDYNKSDLLKLSLEYKLASESSWNSFHTFWKDTTGMNDPSLDLISTNTTTSNYLWKIPPVDGAYDLQVVAHCTQATATSPTHSGVIDRINPHPFGTPSPGDGILEPNDDISIKFNETVDLGAMSLSNFDIRGVVNGTAIRHSTSLYFDGVDDYLNVGGGAFLQKRDFTVEFWAKRNTLGEQAVFSQGSDLPQSIFIGFDATDKFVFRLGTEEVVSTNVVATPLAWHHYAVTYDYENQLAYLFIDAAQVNVGATGIIKDYIGSGALQIGVFKPSNNAFFDGNIHELRLWNKEKSVGDIASEMNILVDKRSTGLLYNWRMDEADGNLAKDHIRRRDAELVGPTWQINPNGFSAQFDGVDDLISVTTSTIPITDEMDFTLEFWFNSTQAGTATLFSNGKGDGLGADSLDSWNIQKDVNGAIHVLHNGMDFIAVDSNYFDGSWNHFALILQRSGNLSAYINGNLQNSTAADDYATLSGISYYLGAKGYYTGTIQTIENFYQGSMDEFRVWNTARKIEQVRRDKQNRLIGDEYGLQVYLPFEDYQGAPLLLTASFNDNSDSSFTTVETGGVVLSAVTPTIKIQRPIEKINFTYSVNNDEIIITPTTAEANIENVTIDITVKDVKDLHGNIMQSPKTWIAYIDKNQIYWQDDALSFEKTIDSIIVFKGYVVNSGGASKTFTISNIPEWLMASSLTGTIAPNSTEEITFTIDQNVNIGDFTADIFLTTDFGYPEKMALDLSVRAIKPDWQLDPNDYQYSMSIIGELEIDAVLSTNIEDYLVAIVNDTVRGLAQLEYVAAYDKYEVFMNVYSNNSLGDSIEFQIWNAGNGQLYTNVTPELEFSSNQIIGTPAVPQRFSTTTLIEKTIALNSGWTWVSFPLKSTQLDDANDLMDNVLALEGDLVKGQTAIDVYSTVDGWVGDITSVEKYQNSESYKVNVTNVNDIKLVGSVLHPDSVDIEVQTGWNYFGYVSMKNLDVNTAMANYNAVTGDVVKSQYEFSYFDDQLGWIGSLQYMESGKGYMLQSLQGDTFNYPIAVLNKSLDHQELTPGVHQDVYAFEPSDYPNTMGIIASTNICNELLSSQEIYLGAFDKNGVMRGVAKPTLYESTSTFIYFLTIHGAQANEEISFKFFNKRTGSELEVAVDVPFGSNELVGKPANALALNVLDDVACDLSITSINHAGEVMPVLSAAPNPFRNQLQVAFSKAIVGTLKITDPLGRVVQTIKINNDPQVTLDFKDTNANGMYFIRLEGSGFSEQIKVVKIK